MKSLILGAIVVASAATAQTAAPPDSGLIIPANTNVAIEIGAPLNSKDSKIGELFPIRLAVPIVDSKGTVLVRAGVEGQGEVIHAARARAMGKAGEMILAARYLQCGGVRLPLGHFKFATDAAAIGKDRSKTSLALSAAVTPLFMFMAGGEVAVPNGARADARITADVAMTKEAAAACGASTKTTTEKGTQ